MAEDASGKQSNLRSLVAGADTPAFETHPMWHKFGNTL